LAKRKAPTEIATAAAYVRRGDAILLRQLPPDAPRWAGLWVLPFAELSATEAPAQGALRALAELDLRGNAKATLRQVQHTITRFRITLSIIECALARPKAARFFTRAEVAELALPSAHARVVQSLW
jgi:adenine-specific DNA glycosylase